MEHYFSEQPQCELKEFEIVEIIRGMRFRFISATGIFSKKRIDEGTKLLAETMVLYDNQKVLDLGCGYGVLGIVAKKICPSCDVWLVDINERALEYAKKNAEINNVDVKVLKSDLFSAIENEKFDNIITNPPFVMGKEIIKKWITESYKHLNNKGMLQLVAYKKYRYVEDMLENVFDHVEELIRQGNYIIYLAIKK